MPKITVIDVGHGNATVIEDKNGIVAVDSGRGSALLDFLRERTITKIEALVLSHADSDHIGGAATLLSAPDVVITKVVANPDGSKGSLAWKNLIAALALARAEGRLNIDVGLHIGTVIREGKAHEVELEVLYPPPEALLSGVGSALSPKATSNSLSAAIRAKINGDPVVLLGGDIEYSCVDYWKQNKANVAAKVVIFPHHGGAPGAAKDVELFAFELSKLVGSEYAVFSIHESMFDLPREDVVNAITKAGIARLLCTRLPEKIKKLVLGGVEHWKWHLIDNNGSPDFQHGHIVIEYDGAGLRLSCMRSRP